MTVYQYKLLYHGGTHCGAQIQTWCVIIEIYMFFGPIAGSDHYDRQYAPPVNSTCRSIVGVSTVGVFVFLAWVAFSPKTPSNLKLCEVRVLLTYCTRIQTRRSNDKSGRESVLWKALLFFCSQSQW